ncbi:MAG: CoA transferase [Candidatus Tectomicrobia bacterium]|uniref:CoA transferase n=1 Tax=Tectimicrobiota bacterium TaxID=2528274 RepID=A0A932CLG3_UNCTE|nr:CoA transferase [Candidatus Tectomicrobia bacterium]
MRKEEFYREARPQSVGPLEGTRVLEATTSYAGPMAGTVLADLGAEVVKVDFPETGELIRHVGPFVPSRSKLDSSAFHLSINRNKKCISLDLRTPEGREIFQQLTARMDIVIENFKPGTMEGWGLGYEEVRKGKPDIIYTSVSGYGQYGPYSHRPGYDHIGQAMGGLMSINGYPDTPPTRTGNAMIDNITGWQGAFGTLAALFCREKTGQGQHVDASLLDSALYTTELGIMAAANANYLWQRMGCGHPAAGGEHPYSCQDGYLVISANNMVHWPRLCRIMGREDLIEDPRTNTVAARAENRKLVAETIDSWTRKHTIQQVLEVLEEAEIVCAPVLNFKQILEVDHIRERGMVAEVEHPTAGRLQLYGVATKFSRTPAGVRTPAPLLGQHNEEVYGNLLGLSRERMAELKEKGII